MKWFNSTCIYLILWLLHYWEIPFFVALFHWIQLSIDKIHVVLLTSRHVNCIECIKQYVIVRVLWAWTWSKNAYLYIVLSKTLILAEHIVSNAATYIQRRWQQQMHSLWSWQERHSSTRGTVRSREVMLATRMWSITCVDICWALVALSRPHSNQTCMA